MRIETKRLLLRPFCAGDENDVFEYLKAPTQSCFYSMKLTSIEETVQELCRRSENPNYFAVVLKASGKVIGEVFAEPEGTAPGDPRKDTYSPCWMINPAFWGNGYGYEAAFAFLDYLFCKKNARRIYIYTEDTNVACQKLCEKLGARKEGVFLEYVSFYCDHTGKPVYENTIQYAILKREWYVKHHTQPFWGSADEMLNPVVSKYHNICTPRRLYELLTDIWCAETCTPRMRNQWTPENKTLGQCSITSFLAQDIFGGKVLGIPLSDGNYHCFNVIGNISFDLTSGQFENEILDYSSAVEQFREIHFKNAEKKARYEILKNRLDEMLDKSNTLKDYESEV